MNYNEEGWVVENNSWASSNHPLELTNEQLYEALEEMDEYHEAAIESLRSQ